MELRMKLRQMKTAELRGLLNGMEADSPQHEEISTELRKRALGTPRRLREGTVYGRDARRAHRLSASKESFKKWFRKMPLVGAATEHLKKVHSGPRKG